MFMSGGGPPSVLVTELFVLPYLVLLIASGSLLYFFKGNLKTRSSDLANFSSISFLKSTSSDSIFSLTYLGFFNGPPVKAIIFPDEFLYSWSSFLPVNF